MPIFGYQIRSLKSLQQVEENNKLLEAKQENHE